MGTKPAPMRVIYRRTDPYGTERAPFEVVQTLVIDDVRFRACAKGNHKKCEKSQTAPIRVCACACHAVD